MSEGFSVRFRERNFGDVLLPPGGVEFTVRRYSRTATGGPEGATIGLSGSRDALWQCFRLLRCPVEIIAPGDEVVWWGYVHAVRAGVWELSLLDVANRVAVAYSYVAPGTNTVGERRTTDWAVDAESVQEYGEIAYLDSGPGLRPEAAEQRRDMLLNWAGRPRLRRAFARAEGDGELECRGWAATLEWGRYVAEALVEAYYNCAGERAFGTDTVSALAQSFVVAGGQSWYAALVRVKLRKEGSPVGGIALKLCADGDGVPGAVLATASISAEEVSGAMAVIEKELSTDVLLAANTTYWLVLDAGTGTSTDYYLLASDTGAGYARGELKRYVVGTGWESTGEDGYFAVGGVRKANEIIGDIASWAQFLAGFVDEAGGDLPRVSPYGDGDESLAARLQALVELGGPHGRRLLWEIDRERRLRIWEASEYDEVACKWFERDGKIIDHRGSSEALYRCPVGEWVRVLDVPPAPGRVMVRDDHYFIERFEYDVGAGTYRVEEARLGPVAGLRR